MPITEMLKKWLIKNCDVEKDANDDEFRKAAGQALVDGKLTSEKYAELIVDAKTGEANEFAGKMDALTSAVEKLVKAQTPPKIEETTEENVAKEAKEKAEKEAKEKGKETPPKTKQPISQFAKTVARIATPTMDMDDKSMEVRVKEAAEMYDHKNKTALIFPEATKTGRPHPMAGKQVMDYSERGRMLDTTTERDKAIIGAYAKFMIMVSKRHSRTMGFQALPQHDKELILYAMEHEKWGGFSGIGDSNYANICDRKLTPLEQKALIEDAVGGSGGVEAVPIVFDSDIIQVPLLNGELFPMVKVVPIDRGTQIEGVSIGTVTGTWGGIDDSAIALFNTVNYVAAFNTTIHRWEGAIRIGLDFLSDTPIDFGQIITQQYGERLLEDLDNAIATGAGGVDPLGVMNTVGTTVVPFGGATTLGNYELLRFAVPKNEHGAGVKASAIFCGTEQSYQRAHSFPVGNTDARRIGGQNYDSYSWMERPYKINESMANNQIFYCIMGRYRMYRRRGLVIRSSTEGDTLMRRNSQLIIAMARYGGQLERGAVAAITTTAPA